jgi:pyruvate/2-oxoglutarate/acetoin dehydrogenase E1 component
MLQFNTSPLILDWGRDERLACAPEDPSMTTVLESLNAALHRAFTADQRVYLIGEDILDPYGGAFKVTRGLSTRYPERVMTAPISEAGITGVAAGMALRGLRPVVEIMFGDFVTLIADQLVNHAAKFRWMYTGGNTDQNRISLPMVIRTPMGGRRGYGPTHSQTLEKLFLGIPGLTILAPCAFGDPGKLLEGAILEGDNPVLFIENKLLYLLPIQPAGDSGEFAVENFSRVGTAGLNFETTAYRVTLAGAPEPAVTIAVYGYMAELARKAIFQLAYESEVFAELVVPTRIAPLDVAPILDSARRTGRLLTLEEGTMTSGWGAEVIARAVETLGTSLRLARRLGAQDLPIPTSGPLEAAVLPGLAEIVKVVQGMV